MYELGIDLGTTYTAAAVRRGGRVEIAPLGTKGPVIPSVVLLLPDGSVLVGEAAQRRSLTDPALVAREFKRRIGDPLPVIVAGEPHSAESLSARLLTAVVAEVTKLEGEAPARIALTHPANWGTYKKDLYAQAVRLADLPEVVFLTEPEAAAIHYASQERVDDGAVVAVYDLGGGTFDATVLRKVGDGFEVLGQPEGIERLGGIDFDQAVLSHVAGALDLDVEGLDRGDPGVLAGVARLRQDCIEAKETLSSDTEASVPVALPGLHTEVRITRPELEAMVRRPISDTVAALRRALRDAGVSPEDLSTVLLVGGSSRMPMVAEMVGSDLGRPVAVDAHPKYAIAMGAARFAGLAAPAAAPTPAPATGPTPVPEPDLVVEEPAPAPAPAPPVAGAAPPSAPPPEPAVPSPQPTPARKKGRTGVLAGAGLAVVAVVAVAAIALGGGGGDGDDGGDDGGDDAAAATGDGNACGEDGPFICLTAAEVSGGQVQAEFEQVGITLGEDATASFFVSSAPESVVQWDVPTDFRADVGAGLDGQQLCALLNSASTGQPVQGTGNCVDIG